MESKYLARFAALQENGVSKYMLSGARVLVEILPPEEIKTASGIILSAPTTHKATAESYRAVVGIVLMTGEGYVDADGNDVPMDVSHGNVVLLNELGLKQFSQFPGVPDYTQNTIAMTSESEVQMRFKDMQDYENYKQLLLNAKPL